MTYHFEDFDELLKEALSRHTDIISKRYAERVATASTLDDLIKAIVDLVHHDLGKKPDELVLTLELYNLAARVPAFRKLTHQWMQRSRQALKRFVDTDTAYDLDALIEGLFIHASLDQPPRPRASTERAIRRFLT